MPIVRSMYERYFDRFIDRVNPFELATPAEHPNPNFRDFIAPMFAAMAMDNHSELKAAWSAIVNHREYHDLQRLLGSDQLNAQSLAVLYRQASSLDEMLALFDAMPTIAGPDGKEYSLSDVPQLGEIRAGWLRGQWADKNLWSAESSPVDEMRKRFGAFFRDNYRRIVELADE